MKKTFLIIAILIVFTSHICYALSADEIVDIFEDIIIEENWYHGEYSNFSKLIDISFEYELYKETYENKKILGEVGEYYLLINKEADHLSSFVLIQIPEFSNGLVSKQYSLPTFTTLEKAKSSSKLENATLIKTGDMKPSFSKLNYGLISKKELGVAQEIISLIKENGSKYYGLESGNYTLYLRRFSIEDGLVPIVLCLPSGKEYYMYVGNLCRYQDYYSIELDVSFRIPKYEGTFYWINQIKKDEHKYSFTLD